MRSTALAPKHISQTRHSKQKRLIHPYKNPENESPGCLNLQVSSVVSQSFGCIGGGAFDNGREFGPFVGLHALGRFNILSLSECVPLNNGFEIKLTV